MVEPHDLKLLISDIMTDLIVANERISVSGVELDSKLRKLQRKQNKIESTSLTTVYLREAKRRINHLIDIEFKEKV